MKALILSAGLGKRLRPLTDIIPKPLADINGKPIIDIIVEKLKNIGIDEFAFNLHHLPEKIREHFSSSSEKIVFSYEDELLDTGGTLASFSDWLDEGDFLIVHNGDIYSDIDIKFLLNKALEKNAPTLALIPNGPVGNVKFCSESEKIVDFRNSLGIDDLKFINCTFSGIAVYPANFIKEMPKGKYSVIDYMIDKLKEKKNIFGVLFENIYWNDIGTHEALEACRKFDLRKGVK